jgi:hypothetical protein
MYDRFIQKRNEKVINAAAGRMLSSAMFPSNVRDQFVCRGEEEQVAMLACKIWFEEFLGGR